MKAGERERKKKAAAKAKVEDGAWRSYVGSLRWIGFCG
jgi:hypothetical protein